MFPSMPQDGDRDADWDADVSREVARLVPKRADNGFGGPPPLSPLDEADDDFDDDEEIEEVPIRRSLTVAVAGFAGLLAVALLVGAQSSGPDARTPYAMVVFGVQLLFVLAWTMATRPAAAYPVAGICALTAAVADWTAATGATGRLLPLLWVTLGALVAGLIPPLIRAEDRLRFRESAQNTAVMILGVVALASLIVLTRRPLGLQTLVVCLVAAGVALVAARLIDAVFGKPRLAPQVPRGATGVIAGAMLGTLAAAGLGSVLVLPFTPAKGAIIGLVAAGLAVLADLAANYAEAGRGMAGPEPTFWVARHMQGPLGAYAVVAPAAYLIMVLMF